MLDETNDQTSSNTEKDRKPITPVSSVDDLLKDTPVIPITEIVREGVDPDKQSDKEE